MKMIEYDNNKFFNKFFKLNYTFLKIFITIYDKLMLISFQNSIEIQTKFNCMVSIVSKNLHSVINHVFCNGLYHRISVALSTEI